MTSSWLTPAMERALAEARQFGVVFAGSTVQGVRVVRHSASTLMALARRELLILSIGPDGGMVGRPRKQSHPEMPETGNP